MKRAIPLSTDPYSRRMLLPVALVLASTGAGAQEEIKLNLRRASDRVVVTWGCDHFQGTNMIAIATDSGVVIIDTGLSTTTVRRQRELIERELGRRDFRFLVNTHFHNDHAFANAVFPEATVVGPTAGVAALQREVAQLPQLLERLRTSERNYREVVAVTRPDSTMGVQAREGAAAFAVGIADLKRGVEPRYPTRTFDDRLTLDLGDVRLELFEFQGLHSESDILILVPEEGLLLTGDVFWGGQFPVLRLESRPELERLLASWQALLERDPDLKLVVPGHSDAPMTVDYFRNTHQYLARLWSDVQAARQAGTPLLSFLLQNVLAERYPEVAGYRVMRRDYNLHQHNVYVLWQLAGQ
ncbi:MAG: MBL fold metallo-hydrolase [Gemmatimonadetes bacterium]|nr:MBL fold metallo-hydrolase [Gemmatimonadota bacterium]